MFFEEDDKDLSKNMDDYDLDFDDDKSIGWDKLLDEADEQQGQEHELLGDDLLLVDDDPSFDDLLKGQPVNAAEITVEKESPTQDFSRNDSLGNFDVDFDASNQTNDEISIIDDSDNIEAANAISVEQPQAQQRIEPQIEPESLYEPQDQYDNVPQSYYQEQPMPQATQSYAGYPPGEQMSGASSQAQQSADDDIDYSADYSKKPSIPGKDKSTMWGIIAAFAAVLFVGVLVFSIYGKNLVSSNVSTGDANELADNIQTEQTELNDGIPLNPDQADVSGDAFATDQPAAPDPFDTPVDNADAIAQKPQVNLPPQQNQQQVSQVQKSAAASPAKTATGAAMAKEADTKKIINIVNTGRANPFTPAANFNNLGFFSSPKMDVLEPPNEIGDLVENVEKLMKITVSGILYDNVKPSAIVTIDDVDYFVQKGDMVDNYIVVSITQSTVSIKDGTNIYRASIGQNFSKSGPIDGQINRSVPTKGVGQRQYVTVDQIDVTTKSQSRDRDNPYDPYRR